MPKPQTSGAPPNVRPDLAAAHARVWEHIREPGTWLTGAVRVQVVAEIRQAAHCTLCADRKAALSPASIRGAHQSPGSLPAAYIEIIHRISTDPGRLTRAWYEDVLAAGVSDGEYVEIVSLIGHVFAVDTFRRAIGMATLDPPVPQKGAPSGYRPKEAVRDDAWVPTIVWDRHGPNEADYFQGRGSNIRRALTLVPDEARSFFRLANHQYLEKEQMMDFDGRYREIDRAQIELLASRVSAINQCVY